MKQVLTLLTILLLVSCGSSSKQVKKQLGPVEKLAEALRLADDGEFFTLRKNPAPCDCPEWEIEINGTWVRVEVEHPFSEMEEEWQTLTQPMEQGEEIEVVGSLSSRPVLCSKTLLCGRFTFEGLPPDPEPIP